jgi:uncharacterized protein with NRDE domain
MGVTKQGRIAVLTNYRENAPIGTVSRGAIVNGFLTKSPGRGAEGGGKARDTRQFVADMIESNTAKRAGGFSLVCGRVHEPLAIVSNRMSRIDGITWIAGEKGETVGLSNTAFGDRSWRKIVHGEELMKAAIDAHVQAAGEEGEDELISRLLTVLSTDTLPRIPGEYQKGQYDMLLRESIFIPLLGSRADIPTESSIHNGEKGDMSAYMQGMYGTQKQTVLLVSLDGRIKYFERTLYDQNVDPIPEGKGDRVFEFMIEK